MCGANSRDRHWPAVQTWLDKAPKKAVLHGMESGLHALLPPASAGAPSESPSLPAAPPVGPCKWQTQLWRPVPPCGLQTVLWPRSATNAPVWVRSSKAAALLTCQALEVLGNGGAIGGGGGPDPHRRPRAKQQSIQPSFRDVATMYQAASKFRAPSCAASTTPACAAAPELICRDPV